MAMAQNPHLASIVAPVGALRVGAYPGSPISMIVDKSGERRGLTVDLGRELARRLGVPFELVPFQRQAEVVEAAKAGVIDFLITNASPARARDLDFMPTLISLEVGYMVPVGSPIVVIGDVDKPEITIGVTKGSTSDSKLPQIVRFARIVPVANVIEGAALLKSGGLQVFATNKPILFEMADGLPGSRVLDGRWAEEHVAIAIPKGREAARTALSTFIEDVKASGLLTKAIERAGLRGALPAP